MSEKEKIIPITPLLAVIGIIPHFNSAEKLVTSPLRQGRESGTSVVIKFLAALDRQAVLLNETRK